MSTVWHQGGGHEPNWADAPRRKRNGALPPHQSVRPAASRRPIPDAMPDAIPDLASAKHRRHDARDDAGPFANHAGIDGSARDALIDRSRIPPSLDPDLVPQPRRSSAVGTLARLGGAIVAAAVAALLVVSRLPGWNGATPNADKAPRPAASEPAAGPAPAATSSPRLVIGSAAPGAVDDVIPLGISLTTADNMDLVALGGLPPGSNVTKGRPSTSGGWFLFAYELADAAIRPAQGFVGGADVAVELWRADRIVDRGTLHFEWAAPQPIPTVVARPVIEPSAGPRPHDDGAEDREALFREFLQWQARRSVRR